MVFIATKYVNDIISSSDNYSGTVSAYIMDIAHDMETQAR